MFEMGFQASKVKKWDMRNSFFSRKTKYLSPTQKFFLWTIELYLWCTQSYCKAFQVVDPLCKWALQFITTDTIICSHNYYRIQKYNSNSRPAGEKLLVKAVEAPRGTTFFLYDLLVLNKFDTTRSVRKLVGRK